MALPTEITVPQLARLVGTSDAPAIVDVRTDEEPGARMPVCDALSRWAPNAADETHNWPATAGTARRVPA